jgi:ligand-binding sensor domain-containing protein
VIPVDADVRALGFQARTADAPQSMWFCTGHGIFRFREGTLDRWGEDNGLPSERCNDLLVRKDGTVCAATSAGPSQFDGRAWRALPRWPTSPDGEGLAAHGLAELGARLWVGTPGGLWSMAAGAGATASSSVDAPATPTWQRDGRPLDSEVVGLTSDRFGRLWALGRSGITRLDP